MDATSEAGRAFMAVLLMPCRVPGLPLNTVAMTGSRRTVMAPSC